MGNGWYQAGYGICRKEIIGVLNRIKYPYNINILTQRTALEHLTDTQQKGSMGKTISWNSEIICKKELAKFPMVKNILPSDANFLMVRFDNPQEVF